MDMLNYTTQLNTQREQENMVNNLRFWEGVLAAGIEVDDGLTINQPLEVEMENAGGIVAGVDGNERGGGRSGEMLVDKGKAKDGDARGSSSGSNKNTVPALVNEEENVVAIVTSLPASIGKI